ncbi:hypothetical protein PN417_09885 [Halorubrum ezzemoulense]|uniref:hypothetical protein n=1 Tax=Halorubrum ezzemoulense TaxID=337243 RepID=UPI00232ADC41|nr:hypothetical protein [Halorubrum ezzemoulense]MDB9301244.1 hypothetical protein [Halorubrum ezzemoulense]
MALMVLVSGLGVGSVAAETPDQALQVVIEEIDAQAGDTVTITVEGPTGNIADINRTIVDEADPTIMPFWLGADELEAAGIDTATIDTPADYFVTATHQGSSVGFVDVYAAADTLEETVAVTNTTETISVDYTPNVSDAAAQVDLFNASSGAYVVTLVDDPAANVTAGETVTGTLDLTTLSLEEGEYIVRPVNPAPGSEIVVGVFEAGGGGGTSSGSGLEGDTSIYVIGAVAVLGLLLVMRD